MVSLIVPARLEPAPHTSIIRPHSLLVLASLLCVFSLSVIIQQDNIGLREDHLAQPLDPDVRQNDISTQGS